MKKLIIVLIALIGFTAQAQEKVMMQVLHRVVFENNEWGDREPAAGIVVITEKSIVIHTQSSRMSFYILSSDTNNNEGVVTVISAIDDSGNPLVIVINIPEDEEGDYIIIKFDWDVPFKFAILCERI
jgi:hypothetical protein